jgi:hypothetical protein
MKEKKMTNNDKRVFGEDKLGRLIRLLDRYEKQMQQDELEAKVSITIMLESDGSGRLMNSSNTDLVYSRTIFNFIHTEGLFKFLESGQLTRTLMSRG